MSDDKNGFWDTEEELLQSADEQNSTEAAGYAFNELTLSEAERLALLLEELGEVQQVIGKILRFGYENYNPFDVNRTKNRSLLERELGDVSAAIKIMIRSSDISSSELKFFEKSKLQKVNKYLHHNEA